TADSIEAEGTGREWVSAAGAAWRTTTAFSETAPRISRIIRERDARRIMSVAAIVAGRNRAVNWRKGQYFRIGAVPRPWREPTRTAGQTGRAPLEGSLGRVLRVSPAGGKVHAHLSALPVGTDDAKSAAAGFRPFPHVQQAETPLGGLLGVETLSVVLDHQRHSRVFLHERDLHVPGLRVLTDVPQGLLGDAEKREARFAGEPVIDLLRLHGDVERFLFAQSGHVFAQRRDEAKIVEHRGV